MLAWVSFKLVNVDITDERLWLSKGSKILNGTPAIIVCIMNMNKNMSRPVAPKNMPRNTQWVTLQLNVW